MKIAEILRKSYSQVFISSPDYDSCALYAQRRAQMMEKLDSFCIFGGMPREPGAEEAFTETWTRFVQDPAFLFLTGVNQPGCYLVLDPKAKRPVLFVPEKDLFREFWNGKRLGVEPGNDDVSRVTGIADVRDALEFLPFVESMAKKYRSRGFGYVYYFEKVRGDHNDRLKDRVAKLLGRQGMKVKTCSPIHFAERLPLGPERIADAKRAQSITEKAFRNLLPRVKSFKNERELFLYLNYEMQRRSDGDLAFPTIAASGENACCLHYVKNDEPLKSGRMILLDFGVRYGTLHSDISRTIPLNGKFNPLQALLYQIVLNSALVYQKSVKPGVSLKEIGQIPWEFIMDELESRLVKAHKGKFKLCYDKRPHGVSHFIGEHIHDGDPGSRSLDTILEPGMLISCEPGLYGEFEGVFNGRRYCEKIGIRIEDDLLITKTGFLNISKKIPKEIAEIERLMQGRISNSDL